MPRPRDPAARTRVALAAALVALAPARAHALPAVLVGAAPLKVRNHRSHLVIARDGPRTTMSLQLDVLAVPMDLAIVLPIHGEVDPDSLRTLDRRLFDRLERLSAPHLVHVWEADPCAPTDPPASHAPPRSERPATFSAGEYEFAALGRIGAGELELWLRERGFPLTEAHAAALAEHFAAGASFVVARVDRRQVHFDARGHAVLSPLRVAFTADEPWRIPLRAGLGHTLGEQEVVLHALADAPADLGPTPAPALPSGLALRPAAADRFSAVYAAVFAAARERHGPLGLREHTAPLPAGALEAAELAALGVAAAAPVLTRLHLRYAPAELPEDPALLASPAAAEQRAEFVIRHPWTGPVACAAPRRGVYGPPPADVPPDEAAPRWVRAMAPARPLAELAPLLAEDVPALGLTAAPAGCACTVDRGAPPALVLAWLIVLAPRRRRSAGV